MFGEKEVEFTTIKIFLAELFGNARLAAIIDRYYTTENVQVDFTSSIKTSYSSKFMPAKFTQEEADEWERNRKLLQGREGIKKTSEQHSSLIKNKL